MSYYNRSKNKLDNQYALGRKVMDYGMGLIYLCVGTFVFFAKYFGITLSFPPEPFNYFFGALIFIYGVFRFYRAYTNKGMR